MKKLLLLGISFFIFVHFNHYPQEVNSFFDVGIVYKGDSYERIDPLPLYTWLSRMQRFSLSDLFAKCKNNLLDLSDVALTKEQHELKSKGIQAKILALCAELSFLSDADRMRYKPLWTVFKSCLSSKMDISIQRVKNKKNFITSTLLYCFPTQAKRDLFCKITQLHYVVFILVFMGLPILNDQPGCRSIRSFPQCFRDNLSNQATNLLGYSVWLVGIVSNLLINRAPEFIDVDQALENKQVVLRILEDVQGKFLNYKK